jgi:hypothetical protein
MKSNEDFPKPTRPREGEYLVSPPAETILKAALRVKPQRAAGPLGCADKNLP